MKRFFKIGAGVLGVLLVAVLALPFLIDANQFRPLLEAKLGDAVGRKVSIGALQVNIWKGKVAAGNLVIGEDPAFGEQPFLIAHTLDIGVEWKPLLFSRQLKVTSVSVGRPEIRLVLSSGGVWNVVSLGKRGATTESSGGSGGAAPLEIGQVSVNDGRFTLVRPGDAPPQVFEDIDVEIHNLSAASAFDFTLAAKRASGGSVTVEGQAGPMNGNGSALPPVKAKFTVPKLDLNASGLVDKSTGVAGLASLSGELATKDNAVNLTGTFRGEQWKLVPRGSASGRPVEVSFAVAHDIVRRAGRLTKLNLAIGAAKASLTGSYNLAGKTPAFAFKFAGDKMPLTELAAALPALDIVLPGGSRIEAGAISLRADVAGTLASFASTGPISIEGAKLAGFDLGSSMRTIQLLAGIPNTPVTEIQTLSAMVKRMPDGTSIEDISMVVPTIGNLVGAGTISPDNQMNFKMRATLHTSGSLMQAIGQKGDTTVPFLITGSTNSPSFKADAGAIARQKVEQLTKDPQKTVEAAKDIFNMFRKPKAKEPPQQ